LTRQSLHPSTISSDTFHFSSAGTHKRAPSLLRPYLQLIDISIKVLVWRAILLSMHLSFHPLFCLLARFHARKCYVHVVFFSFLAHHYGR
jgi:hypothetical protein